MKVEIGDKVTQEQEFQHALDIIGKQDYKLSVLKNGLEKLKNDRTWQSVEEVNAYICRLLAVLK